jgi:SAM-dependent methyltransferase
MIEEKTLTIDSSTDLRFNLDCIDPFDQDNDNLWIKLEHLGRYLFAADYLRRLKPDCVADIACGVGYGLTELEKAAASVIGIDHNAEILERAESHCCTSKTQLLQHDLAHEDWFNDVHPESVDAVVSFETLEHLVEPANAVAKFSRLLKPKGFFIFSVPNALYEPCGATGLPTNPAHKQLFNGRSLRHLLEQNGFQICYQVGQARSNMLYKRESQLLKHGAIKQRIGDYPQLHDAEIVRHLSYLLAYPTIEDIDGSYSLIFVAQKGISG